VLMEAEGWRGNHEAPLHPAAPPQDQEASWMNKFLVIFGNDDWYLIFMRILLLHSVLYQIGTLVFKYMHWIIFTGKIVICDPFWHMDLCKSESCFFNITAILLDS
jgi:hypothetical protein